MCVCIDLMWMYIIFFGGGRGRVDETGGFDFRHP